MATHSNPRRSLSRRIRASFDGKRSKTDDSIPISPPMSPTSPAYANPFAMHDPAVLRDAISQAITSNSFQSAIASHLAKLVEPSIKTALDTIQPVVEKVYQHELSIRRINATVENVLLTLHPAARASNHERSVSGSNESVSSDEVKQILAEHNNEHDKRLSQLSSHVAESRDAITTAVADIAEIKSHSALWQQNLSAIKQDLECYNAGSSTIQAQLTELKTDVDHILAETRVYGNNLAQIRDRESNSEILTAVHTSHTSQSKALDEIKAMNRSFTAATIPVFEKSHTDTASAFEILTVNLNSLDQNIRKVSTSNGHGISDLKTKVDGLLSAVDGLNNKNMYGDVLTAVQKSNELQASHAAQLDEIKQNYTVLSSEKKQPDYHDKFASFEQQISILTTAAESHSMGLQGVQRAISGDLAPSVRSIENLEAQLNGLTATLDSHGSILNEIRDSDRSTDIVQALHASNESHTAHSNALAQILDKDSNSHILTAIHDSHHSQSVELDEIKASMRAASELHTSHAKAIESVQTINCDAAERLAAHTGSLEAFGAHMETVLTKLQEHSAAHSQIIDSVHRNNVTLVSNTTSFDKSETTSLEILSSAKNAQALLERYGDVLALHTDALDDIKATNNHEETIGHISAVKSIAEDLKSSINAHSSAIKDLHTEVQRSNSEITDIGRVSSSGVHLNEKGLAQLKDHVKASRAATQDGFLKQEEIAQTAQTHSSNIDEAKEHIPEGVTAALAAVTGGGLTLVADKEFKHDNTEQIGESRDAEIEPTTEMKRVTEEPSKKPLEHVETEESVGAEPAIVMDTEPAKVAEPVIFMDAKLAVEDKSLVEAEPAFVMDAEPVMEAEPVIFMDAKLAVEDKSFVEAEPAIIMDAEPVMEAEPAIVMDAEPVMEAEPLVEAGLSLDTQESAFEQSGTAGLSKDAKLDPPIEHLSALEDEPIVEDVNDPVEGSLAEKAAVDPTPTEGALSNGNGEMLPKEMPVGIFPDGSSEGAFEHSPAKELTVEDTLREELAIDKPFQEKPFKEETAMERPTFDGASNELQGGTPETPSQNHLSEEPVPKPSSHEDDSIIEKEETSHPAAVPLPLDDQTSAIKSIIDQQVAGENDIVIDSKIARTERDLPDPAREYDADVNDSSKVDDLIQKDKQSVSALPSQETKQPQEPVSVLESSPKRVRFLDDLSPKTAASDTKSMSATPLPEPHDDDTNDESLPTSTIEAADPGPALEEQLKAKMSANRTASEELNTNDAPVTNKGEIASRSTRADEQTATAKPVAADAPEEEKSDGQEPLAAEMEAVAAGHDEVA